MHSKPSTWQRRIRHPLLLAPPSRGRPTASGRSRRQQQGIQPILGQASQARLHKCRIGLVRFTAGALPAQLPVDLRPLHSNGEANSSGSSKVVLQL